MKIIGSCYIVNEPAIDEKQQYSDIVIGRKYFGSSMKSIHKSEHLVNHLRSRGVILIVAESFGRSFYRNCINFGLPAIECTGIYLQVNNGDILEVDLEIGIIKNISSGKNIIGKAVPKLILDILAEGGIVQYTTMKCGIGKEK